MGEGSRGLPRLIRQVGCHAAALLVVIVLFRDAGAARELLQDLTSRLAKGGRGSMPRAPGIGPHSTWHRRVRRASDEVHRRGLPAFRMLRAVAANPIARQGRQTAAHGASRGKGAPKSAPEPRQGRQRRSTRPSTSGAARIDASPNPRSDPSKPPLHPQNLRKQRPDFSRISQTFSSICSAPTME